MQNHTFTTRQEALKALNAYKLNPIYTQNGVWYETPTSKGSIKVEDRKYHFEGEAAIVLKELFDSATSDQKHLVNGVFKLEISAQGKVISKYLTSQKEKI